jgi:uncharacterized protein (DUF1015 family)
MAKIIPFRGLLYNPDRVSANEVLAPPYDIISPEHKDILYGKSPYNIVRVDFGRKLPGDDHITNRYSRAKTSLAQWEKEGVMVRDDMPCYYACEVAYELPGNKKKNLRGILALLKIEELGQGVYPHEATHSKPKADRLNLMKACLANVSPIYSLYNSPARITSSLLEGLGGDPHISAQDPDGAVHSLYKIDDPEKIALITQELYDKSVFIADGHHRYEVALEFKREMDAMGCPNEFFPAEDACASRPWDYVLMFLANMADEGITILPTHRMIKGIAGKEEIFSKLAADFTFQTISGATDVLEIVAAGEKNTFGLYLYGEDSWHVLRYRENDRLKDLPPALGHLDVVVLHELILKRDLGITDIAYEMDVREAMGRVRRGDFDGVFFLNPTGVQDVERVALSGLRMPPKSTYFYPKLLTGMVINSFKH